MGLKICVLASGSSGNCTLIQSDSCRILVDAGLSARETGRRLAQVGLAIEDIDAILIGHEHGDHIRGLDVLARKHKRPVYMNRATAEAVNRPAGASWDVRIFTTSQSWTTGDLTVTPFPVFHDAQEPVGFSIRWEETIVVIATDLGMPTAVVKDKIRSARVVVMEANHDPALLMAGDRPWALKQRIRGTQGHLANDDAADLIALETGEELSDVFLAHLSRDCNRPDLVLKAVKGRLEKKGRAHVRVWLTYHDRISEMVEVSSPPPRRSPGETPAQPHLPGW
jgi:phosphoribosyl 1,2-cyclic phosphodiesterase